MLLPKRELFCQEYLKDLNGRQAAIRAGYSPATAEFQASRLLRNGKVKARVEELIAKRQKRLEISVDDVLRRLVSIMDVDASEAFHPDGSPKSIHDIPKEVRKFINIEGSKKYSLFAADRVRAMDTLLKHLKIKDDEAKEAKEKDASRESKSRDVQIIWSERPVDQNFYDKPASGSGGDANS